jgi:hypothetical protein
VNHWPKIKNQKDWDMKKKKPEKQQPEEWDLSEGMGILPSEISLTQNIGCVGGKPKKPKDDKPNSENKS